MAETFLYTIAERVLAKITSVVIHHQWDLENDLKKLQENLLTIKAVLLDAEEKQLQNHELRLWLGRLRSVCYNAEDVLDELEYESLRKQALKQSSNTKNKVRRFFSSSNPLAFHFKMSRKIKELRERLDEIANQKSRFHLVELVDYRLVVRRQREMTDSLLRTSNVIGREHDKELIMKFLLGPNVCDSVSVIPIVGIGGLGKTTLAKLLYNDERVDEYFQLKLWVCASEEFDKTQIMINMIKSLTHENRSDLDPDQLQTCIQGKLNAKKFLIILDDLWSDDRGKWMELRDLFDGGDTRSKVIVTTRSSSVATIVGTTSAYNLKGLCHEDCLSLFKKWAFKEGEEKRYPNLMEMGNDIVMKCGGLPLAVRTLGTLLYSKNDEHYWKFIRDNEIWKFDQKEGDILPVLRLSYDQMPSHLKPCFAICSIFPKDHVFDSYALVQLWMAHGLLQPSYENQELEDVGLQYMKELYSRSFFQDFGDYVHFMVFKMHDLVHNLALSVAQSDYMVLDDLRKNISEEIRHLSFADNVTSFAREVPSLLRKSNHLRTIIFPTEAEGPITESFINRCISICKCLRMIDLSGSSFEVLPSSIGGLKHLRILNLSANDRIKKLPDSICKLHNLQALLAGKCSQLTELPRDIKNMIRLRFLEITIKQNHLPENGIGCLQSLRYLSLLQCTNLELLFEGMQRLTCLRMLNIWNCNSLRSLPRNLRQLTALENLFIGNCEKLDLLDGDVDQDIKSSLQLLIFSNLPLLTTLPQWLQKSTRTLQCIRIIDCENFSSLPEWLPNCTSLKKIEIQGCPQLLTLPEGMHQLLALNELKIKDCPTLSERCKKETGEDWHKIAHVPEIELDDQDNT
ncbi:putative disease resistance protein RGA3 [Tripterygium wilfordii]|uniref:putative disease resistance protein RGA3 n=1 Tax=Tripterygium wilfordii TaxID=458696 RepID=UPI0018F8632B|nr:putative disease resistance protein RGA3 [Tripterygium wilfordii]XP_038681533.1 putative disease resistance protein RGA3 [Tripterygium wilfordii]